MSVFPGAPIEGEPRCSRVRCRESAQWAIVWRNPKLHHGDRRKVWLACDAHREVLREFLEARNFPLEIRAVEDI